MRVLVTGASGFIGSHVVESLVEAKFEVMALAHYNSRGDDGWLKDQ
jgi:nucleoside-diphosphate-sugar epimerase